MSLIRSRIRPWRRTSITCDEDQQVEFKGKAKAFVRTYGFLSAILPYTNASWEKLSIFLNFLISKLPAPKEEDLSKGILETIDMDSYRVEKKAAVRIQFPIKMERLSRFRLTVVGARSSPSSIGYRTSSMTLTTTLGISTGTMAIGCAG